MSTHDPATTESVGFPVKVRLAKGESFQDAFGFGFNLPTFVFVLDMAGGQTKYGVISHGSAFLRQEAEGGSTLHAHFPVVGCAVTHQHGEERGFPGAIGTDETDLVPALKVKGHAAEEGAAGVGFADLSD